MQRLLLAVIGIVLVAPAAVADGMSLAGSLWQCTRSTDQSQFVITFYPGGEVGGGELQNNEVSPTSSTPPGRSRGSGPGYGNRQVNVSHGCFRIRAFGSKAGSQDLVSRLRGSPAPELPLAINLQ